MANVKLVYGGSTETMWNSTGRITTPSLILVDGSTTRYTPLYSGSGGGTITDGNYKATLGHLIVADKRCAISRWQYKFTNSVRIGFYYTETVNTGASSIWNYCGNAYTVWAYTKYRNMYIQVVWTTINNGSLKHIYVEGGSGTTSTDWYCSKSETSSGTSQNPSGEVTNSFTAKIYATFTSSTGTDYTVYSTVTFYKDEQQYITLSREFSI